MYSTLLKQVKIFCEHLGVTYLHCRVIGDGKKNRKINLSPENCAAIKLKPTENAYFLPQQTVGYTDNQVTGIFTLFIDIDTEPIDRNYKIEPNFLSIRSDQKAAQIFWFLDEPLTRPQFDFCIKKLIKKYDSDPKVTNPARLMRLCGLNRGTKHKDAIYKIDPNLFYNFTQPRQEKLTKEDLALLIDCNVSDILNATPDNILITINKPTIPTTLEYITDQVEEDYSIECNEFFNLFGRRQRGTGTSTELFAFACRLLRENKSLEGMIKYAKKKGKSLDILGLDGQPLFDKVKDWEHVIRSSREAEQKRKKSRSASFDWLAYKYPLLATQKESLLNSYFYPKEDRFYEIVDDFYGESPKKFTSYKITTFNTRYKRFFSYLDEKQKEKFALPSEVFLDKNNSNVFLEMSGFCYCPHKEIVHENKLNNWQRPKYDPDLEKKGTIDPFVNHVKKLLGNQTTEKDGMLDDLFLDYIAYTYCSEQPANFHWIIRSSAKGVGKSTLAAWIIAPIFGRKNVTIMSSEHLEDAFTSFEQSEIVIVEELGGDLFKKLKPIMSSPRISVRKMRKEAETIERTFVFIFFTNEAIPIVIEQGDRRILYTDIDAKPAETGYMVKLKAWADKPENIAAAANYLKTRYQNMSSERRERMLGSAPSTAIKDLIVYSGLSGRLQNLCDIIPAIAFGDDEQFVYYNDIPLEYYSSEQGKEDLLRNVIKNDMEKLGYVYLRRGKAKPEHFKIVTKAKPKGQRCIIFIKSNYYNNFMKDEENNWKFILNTMKKKFDPDYKEPIQVDSIIRPNEVDLEFENKELHNFVAMQKSSWISQEEPKKLQPEPKSPIAPDPVKKTYQKIIKKSQPTVNNILLSPEDPNFFNQFFNNKTLSINNFVEYCKENNPVLTLKDTSDLIKLREAQAFKREITE
jgi:hypothetical protein